MNLIVVIIIYSLFVACNCNMNFFKLVLKQIHEEEFFNSIGSLFHSKTEL